MQTKIITKAIEALCAELELELQAVEQSVAVAAQAATHSENKAENKYDTRGLEASYLAGAQAERAAGLRATLLRLRHLATDYSSKARSVIGLTSLVGLEDDQGLGHYLLLPVAGGYKLNVDERTITTLTLDTPLGKKLLGKEEGDVVELRTAQGTRTLSVVSID